MTTLHLHRTHRIASTGLEELRLSHPNGEWTTVYSGVASRQNFRTRASQVARRLEPIPEGVYTLGPIEWAGGQGNYDVVWSSALGPVWCDIDPTRAIGFHLDANSSVAPGSAGCVVFPTLAALQKFVRWFGGRNAPQRLIVNWGMGTVKDEEAK